VPKCYYLSPHWEASIGENFTNQDTLPVQEFLEKAHELFEMHIYTHGNAEYAIEMACLLDPSRRYFAERIMSQVTHKFQHVMYVAAAYVQGRC
jgi:TFIIF-interacting CTD phosphatase-like protein